MMIYAPETIGITAPVKIDELSTAFAGKIINGEYNYVYLDTINESFINTYGNLFVNKDVKDGAFYRVDSNNGRVELKLIGD